MKFRSLFDGRQTFKKAMAMLSAHIVPSSVIDVGVANGTPELYAAFSPDRYKYLLIEANPEKTNYIARLSKRMGADYNICFCGDEEGEVDFYIQSEHEKSTRYSRGARDEHKVVIQKKKLDTLVTDLPKPYLLKIDVEGAQVEVLRGATEVLKDTIAIIIEAPLNSKNGSERFGDVVAYLNDKGFIVRDIFDISYKDGKMNLCNIVFVRP